jgi:hypothetical protein
VVEPSVLQDASVSSQYIPGFSFTFIISIPGDDLDKHISMKAIRDSVLLWIQSKVISLYVLMLPFP